MPRNGAGSYALPEPAFVPSTPISSSAVNSDMSDIATALTGSVAADGQTTITGALKAANGAVGTPSYSFASDLNTGLYRAGADNPAIAAGGTKIVDITTTGIAITGTITPSGQVVGSAGSNTAPSYSFSGDLNTGFYQAGADNPAIAAGGTKIVDVTTTGINVIGTVSSNGAVLAPIAYAVGMQNGTLVESHAASAVTFAVKTFAGADPSASDPVFMIFRNSTAATGNYTVRTITSALSVTVSAGSTLGATNSIPFRVWVGALDNAGTPELFVINCLSGVNIYALGQFPIITTTTEGGSGGADSAQVPYSTTGRTSKPYIVLGYASYESGLATVGTWGTSPTRLQLHGINDPLPGQRIQFAVNQTGAQANGASTSIPFDDSIPQITEGAEQMTLAITPTSAANVLVHAVNVVGDATGTRQVTAALFQGATSDALVANTIFMATSSQAYFVTIDWAMLSGTTSSTTFRTRVGSSAADAFFFNGSASSTRIFGGVCNSFMRIEEIMA